MPVSINVKNIIPHKILPVRRRDLTGNRYGRLLVLGIYGIGSKNKHSYFSCKCDCGNVCIISSRSLVEGITKSCGCIWREHINSQLVDLSGKVFGRLTVIEFSHKSKNNNFWKCLCRCGNYTKAHSTHLTYNRVRSCGCLKSEVMSAKSGENHHWFRTGKSTPYPTKWNDKLKESIRNRDSRKCQYPECTYTDLENRKLDVHHIDGNKKECGGANLISLCHGHHMTVESNPKSWEKYFYKITRKYKYGQ